MKLNELIDFSYFAVNNFEGISDNDTSYIINANQDVPYFIDHEIENNPKDRKACTKLLVKYFDFLGAEAGDIICDNPYTELKNTYLDEDALEECCFYKASPYYIFFFRINHDETQLSLTGIIKNDGLKYIFIGAEGEKYFIHTDKFTYVDSSGIAHSDFTLIDPRMDYEELTKESNKLRSSAKPKTILDCISRTADCILKESIAQQY